MNRQKETKTCEGNVHKCVCFTVESMFSAMCECQALHPDPEDEDSDNDFEGEEYDLEGAGMGENIPTHTQHNTHKHTRNTHNFISTNLLCLHRTYLQSGEPLPATRKTLNC